MQHPTSNIHHPTSVHATLAPTNHSTSQVARDHLSLTRETCFSPIWRHNMSILLTHTCYYSLRYPSSPHPHAHLHPHAHPHAHPHIQFLLTESGPIEALTCKSFTPLFFISQKQKKKMSRIIASLPPLSVVQMHLYFVICPCKWSENFTRSTRRQLMTKSSQVGSMFSPVDVVDGCSVDFTAKK